MHLRTSGYSRETARPQTRPLAPADCTPPAALERLPSCAQPACPGCAAGLHAKFTGDHIYDGLVNGFRGVQFGGPKPCSSGVCMYVFVGRCGWDAELPGYTPHCQDALHAWVCSSVTPCLSVK